MLCEVDRSYIEDGFNLYGLRHHFSNFQGCLDIILDRTDEPQDPVVAQSAFMLYGMIHARFIVTARGLEAMYKKYRLAEFGRCPRTMCRQQPVVPVGIFDEPKKEAVKLYCPRCGDVYNTVSPYGGEPLDGAFFGTSFAHLFFITFDRLVPDPASDTYTPLIFGFKIHKSAKCMQRRLPHGRGSPPLAAVASAAATATNSSASSSAPAHLKSPRAGGGVGTGSKGTAAGGAMASAGSGGRSDLSNIGRGSSWGDAGGDASGGGKGVLWGGTCAGEGSCGSAVMSGRDGKDGGTGGGGGGSGRSRSGTAGSGGSRRKSRRSSTGAGSSGAADGGGGGRSSSRSSTKGKGKDKRRKRESQGLEEREDERDDGAGETRRRGRKQQDTSSAGNRLRRDGSQDSTASGLTQASAGGGGSTSANGTGGGITRARSPSLSSAQDIGESRSQQVSERGSAGPGSIQSDDVVSGGPVSGCGGVAGGREASSQAGGTAVGEENGKDHAHAEVGSGVDANTQGLGLGPGHDEQTHLVHPPGSSGRGQHQGPVASQVGMHFAPAPSSASLNPVSQASVSGITAESVTSSEGIRLGNSNGDDPLSAVAREGGLATLAAAAISSGSFSSPPGIPDSVTRDSAMRGTPGLDASSSGARNRREVDVGCDSRGPTSDPRIASPTVGTKRSPGFMSVSPTSTSGVPSASASTGTSTGIASTKDGEGDGHGKPIMARGSGASGLPLPLGPSHDDGPSRSSTARTSTARTSTTRTRISSPVSHDRMVGRLAPASETDMRELLGKLGGCLDGDGDGDGDGDIGGDASNMGISTSTSTNTGTCIDTSTSTGTGIGTSTEVRSRVGGDGGRTPLAAEVPVLSVPPSTSKGIAREELEARAGLHGPEREGKRMRLD